MLDTRRERARRRLRQACDDRRRSQVENLWQSCEQRVGRRPRRGASHGLHRRPQISLGRTPRRQQDFHLRRRHGPNRTSAATTGGPSDVQRLIAIASDQKPRERCIWMTAKSAFFGARRADVIGRGAREPRVEGLALLKSVESGNLSLNKVGIRWMSGQRSAKPCSRSAAGSGSPHGVPDC